MQKRTKKKLLGKKDPKFSKWKAFSFFFSYFESKDKRKRLKKSQIFQFQATDFQSETNYQNFGGGSPMTLRYIPVAKSLLFFYFWNRISISL